MYIYRHLHPDHVVYDLIQNSKTCMSNLPVELINNIYEFIFDSGFCSYDKTISFHYDIKNESNVIRTDIACIKKINHNEFVLNLANFALLKRFYYKDDVLLPIYTHEIRHFVGGIRANIVEYIRMNNHLLYLCLLMKIHDFLPRSHYVVNWYNKSNEFNYEMNWLFNNFTSYNHKVCQ